MNNRSAVPTGDRKFLIFRMQDSLYALDLAQTAEVADLTQLWPIPLAPPCYSGAMNFHGDIIAVMDLSLFLGLSGGNRPEKMIVLHQSIASLALLLIVSSE
ncbi:MAG: chemotaxis protein CheW, partial [Desulfuromonadaceae bacterium]